MQNKITAKIPRRNGNKDQVITVKLMKKCIRKREEPRN